MKLTDQDFLRLVSFVGEYYGINLEKKREMVLARLSLMLTRQGYESYSSYLDAVIANPDGPVCREMIDRLSTNHTFFFRGPACIQHMIRSAIPELVHQGRRDIRIWCAASSSGQECYSIAMELEQYCAGHLPGLEYSILASDISEKMLAQGKAGRFGSAERAHIPPEYIRKYVAPLPDGGFEVAARLKDHITWTRQNLMSPFPVMPPFDFIFCRNVMFYFRQERRTDLINRLSMLLRPKGYLYIGVTETLQMQSNLRYVAPSTYQKLW